MASSSAGNSTNGPKQGISIVVQNALLPQTPLEDEANSEAEAEPGSSSDSMNVSSSTRVPVPGKLATSAFEIIAVEMQPDSASSPGNGTLHHSSLSLGGVTNDTDQEQDFQMNGNGVAGEEGLATESESEAPPVYAISPTNVDQRSEKLHLSPPQEMNGNAVNSEALITTTNLPPTGPSYAIETPVQQAVTVAPPVSVLPPATTAAPAPSISTIKTETGREITILKVEAEFRRGRWACSDYHDHRDTSPPPPNPSPAAVPINQAVPSTQAAAAQQPQVVQQAPTHLPVLLEQQQQQQNSVPVQQKQPGANPVMAPPPPMGMTPISMQQPRYPQQQQQQVYSTQQMVEKTAAALSRALSTDPSGYPVSASASFPTFSSHTNAGIAAPVVMQSAGAASTVVGAGGSTGFFSTGHVAPGASGGMTDLAAIEVKVSQALDLVKKYLMAAVRHELEAMQGEVVDLQNRLEAVQRENMVLRQNVPDDVLQNLLLTEQIPSAPVPPQMMQQNMTGTPLGAVPTAVVENAAAPVSMATPSSPSFAVSSSPNGNQPQKTSTAVNVVRQQQQQQPPSQQPYYPPRERSPSTNSVDMADQRSVTNNGEIVVASGGFDDSSPSVVQT